MRKLVLLLCLLSGVINAQMLEYSKLSDVEYSLDTYTSYLSKDGILYKVGDTVNIAAPSGFHGHFVYFYKIDVFGNIYYPGHEAANTSAIIKKVKITGSRRSGFKAMFQTKGFTALDNYFITIEDAIIAGEVKGNGYTSDQALSDLKRAKDKLDLGLITRDEYDKKKAELSPYIK